MFKVRQKVRFIDEDRQERMPWCYPPVGWTGIIIEANDDETALVNWGEDSGVEKCSDGYVWWVGFNRLEAVDAEN